MDVTDDLVEWLRAQLEEDERVARATLADNVTGRWHPQMAAGYLHEAVTDESGVRLATGPQRINEHIALHDPVRVLRDVAAGLKLIAVYEEAKAYYDAHREAPAGEVTGLRTAIQLLAAGSFGDRPGLREEWLYDVGDQLETPEGTPKAASEMYRPMTSDSDPWWER